MRRAIDLAPRYALPKAVLSWTSVWDMMRRWIEADAFTISKARRLADQAIACDDDEAWAHMALGICLVRAEQLESACLAFQDALDRNPSFALAHGFLGAAEIYLDRVEDGRRRLLESNRLSPNDPTIAMNYSAVSSALALEGRFGEAIELATKATRLNASYAPGFRNLVVALAAFGQIDRAKAAVVQLLELYPTLTVMKFVETSRSGGRAAKFAAHWLRVAGLPEE